MAAPAPLRIFGLGLAGSLLAWKCEQAGLEFELVDPNPAAAASCMAAGIINPITGQRFVPSWRINELLPCALSLYQEMERVLNATLVFRYRLRRSFTDAREQRIATEKWERGELAPFAHAFDSTGFWIEPAFRVDLQVLTAKLRERWTRMKRISLSPAPAESDVLNIWCIGAGELKSERFRFAGLAAAKGEILDLETSGLVEREILSRKYWLLPLSASYARIGATYQPNDDDINVTAGAKDLLQRGVRDILGDKPFEIVLQSAGVRVVSPDKRPVVGKHPRDAFTGIFNGLGSKGALLAPWLAQEWIELLTQRRTIDAAVDVARFFRD